MCQARAAIAKAGGEQTTEAPPIIVSIIDGLIDDITGIPADVEVQVHDYDIEGCDRDSLFTDDDGQVYASQTFYA